MFSVIAAHARDVLLYFPPGDVDHPQVQVSHPQAERLGWIIPSISVYWIAYEGTGP